MSNLRYAEQGLAIAKGIVKGHSSYSVVGIAPDFDTGDGIVTLWGGANDAQTWQLMKYVYSTTADIDSISSSDAGDTQTITILGLDTNWVLTTQTVALNGQNRVALSTSLVRVLRAWNSSSTNVAGFVFIYKNGAITGGIPNTNADIRAVIYPEHQKTKMAMFTVPAGKTGYIIDSYAGSLGASRSASYDVLGKVRLFGEVFTTEGAIPLKDSGTSFVPFYYDVPLGGLPEKTDIELDCSIADAAITAAKISGQFGIILVDN